MTETGASITPVRATRHGHPRCTAWCVGATHVDIGFGFREYEIAELVDTASDGELLAIAPAPEAKIPQPYTHAFRLTFRHPGLPDASSGKAD